MHKLIKSIHINEIKFILLIWLAKFTNGQDQREKVIQAFHKSSRDKWLHAFLDRRWTQFVSFADNHRSLSWILFLCIDLFLLILYSYTLSLLILYSYILIYLYLFYIYIHEFIWTSVLIWVAIVISSSGAILYKKNILGILNRPLIFSFCCPC